MLLPFSGMTIRVGMHEAKSTLSKLVERAHAGEEIVIERSGEPVAELVPIRRAPVDRSAGRGAWRGRVRIADDFDELPDELREVFGVDADR